MYNYPPPLTSTLKDLIGEAVADCDQLSKERTPGHHIRTKLKALPSPCGVYQVTTPQGYTYVGSTVDLYRRFGQHLHRFGPDIKFTVLVLCDEQNHRFYEQRAIDADFGYLNKVNAINKTPAPLKNKAQHLEYLHSCNRRMITYNGVIDTLQSHAKRCGVSPGLVRSRLNSGWTVADALEKPKPENKYYTYMGKTMTAYAWAKHLDIKYPTLLARIRRGLSGAELFAPVYKK